MEAHFCCPTKSGNSCDFFIINTISLCMVAICGSAHKNKILADISPNSNGYIPYTNTHKHRTSYFRSTLPFLGQAKRWKSISATQQNPEIIAISSSSIRGQHAVSQADTSPNSLGYAIHKQSQALNIIFQVYTHISGTC